jgi:hypothetical protein
MGFLSRLFGRSDRLGKVDHVRPPETICPPRIEFVGEQSGPVEDDLKARFRQVFRNSVNVQRAYLARLSYGEPSSAHSVALCIFSSTDVDQSLQEHLGKIFTELFKPGEHLDILFVRSDQEEQLKSVCRPFYEATWQN